MSWMLCRESKRANSVSELRLDVEAEQHHVAVLDDIVLALGAELAGVARAGFAAAADVIVVGDRLGADEAALEVGVDFARGLAAPWRLCARSRRALPWARR